MELKQALEEIRKEKRNFEQTVDLIVNLRGINIKKDSINAVVIVPNKFKDKKVCAFLTKRNSQVDTITQPEFAKYKDKKELKKLAKKYDFFIASAPVMPAVASTFGKVLGPTGKMPTPQLGLLMQETDANITALLKKLENSNKIKAKETSIKISVGKEKMDDAKIIENINSIYNGILEALPNKKENVKSVLIKTTMSKPIKVEVK